MSFVLYSEICGVCYGTDVLRQCFPRGENGVWKSTLMQLGACQLGGAGDRSRTRSALAMAATEWKASSTFTIKHKLPHSIQFWITECSHYYDLQQHSIVLPTIPCYIRLCDSVFVSLFVSFMGLISKYVYYLLYKVRSYFIDPAWWIKSSINFTDLVFSLHIEISQRSHSRQCLNAKKLGVGGTIAKPKGLGVRTASQAITIKADRNSFSFSVPKMTNFDGFGHFRFRP